MTPLPFHPPQRQEWIQRQVVSAQQKLNSLPFLKVLPFGNSELDDDDGSLARPPVHLSGRVRYQRSFVSDDESGASQFSESSDSDGVDSDGDASGLQWCGFDVGGFTAEEEDDEEL
jgi:hypothetical protein